MKKASRKKTAPLTVVSETAYLPVLASLDRAMVAREKAKRALAAESEPEPQEAGIDPTLPSNPITGEPGHQVPESTSDDEDGEGHSLSEQLFEEGAKQAERDKVSQASHTRGKK